MSGGDERGRWLEVGDPNDLELARMLAAGRDERPSAARRQRLAERLAQSRGKGGDGGESGGGPASSTSGILSVVAATTLLALSALWFRHAPAASEAREAAAPHACSTCEAPRVTRPSVDPLGTRDAGVGSTGASTPAASASRAPQQRGGRGHERQPQDPMLELQLLDQASRALASDPARALALTERHARLFPHSQLNQERELIAIEALVYSGAEQTARRRIARFLTAYPGSSHAPRVRALAAGLAGSAPAPQGDVH